MSPFPVRVETNARYFPSGEYSGRDSVAGSETSKCASPPEDGTIQISPPLTKAISLPSGEIPGSLSTGISASADRQLRASNPRITINLQTSLYISLVHLLSCQKSGYTQ